MVDILVAPWIEVNVCAKLRILFKWSGPRAARTNESANINWCYMITFSPNNRFEGVRLAWKAYLYLFDAIQKWLSGVAFASHAIRDGLATLYVYKLSLVFDSEFKS